MERSFSLYLDLVRFLAALLVYVYHSNQRWLVAEVLPLSHYGHSAVVVFFVLSGYVISYVTDSKENDWRSYAASRFARVYSVVVPTLLLTPLLDTVGRSLYPAVYAGYPFDQLLLRLGLSFSMLNELWFVSVTSLSNVPYWSITFESWYYLLFGLWSFAPARWRWPLMVAGLLIAGPKIALMAPLWALGVLLYRLRASPPLRPIVAWGLLLGSSVAVVGLHSSGTLEALHVLTQQLLGEALTRELTFAKFVLGDYVLAAAVVLQFYCMRQLAPHFDVLLLPLQRPIRWLAGYTFTLYLLHQPLFLFWGAVLRLDPKGIGAWLLVSALVGLSVVGVGVLTEGQRHRLRAALLRGLARLGRRAVAA